MVMDPTAPHSPDMPSAPPAEEPPDYRVFREGDVFPPLNKKIHILQGVVKDWIVFLDDKFRVHHWYRDEPPEDYGAVALRVEQLDTTSFLLVDAIQLEAFRRLLAESIARVLDDGHGHNASICLQAADNFLQARTRERARIWYLSATLCTAAFACIAGLLFWKYSAHGFAAQLVAAAAMGAFGALVSVLLRSDDLKTDFLAGRRVHYFEGSVRILVGATAGFVFALSIKADLVLGMINRSENPLVILLVFSFVAGASERLLPSLIRQIEGTLIKNMSAAAELPGRNRDDLTQLPEDGGQGSLPSARVGAKRQRTRPVPQNPEQPS